MGPANRYPSTSASHGAGHRQLPATRLFLGPSLLLIGLIITLIGAILTAFEKFGIKKIPGDILIQKGNVTFFFPIVTGIVLSIVLTVIINIFLRNNLK